MEMECVSLTYAELKELVKKAEELKLEPRGRICISSSPFATEVIFQRNCDTLDHVFACIQHDDQSVELVAVN